MFEYQKVEVEEFKIRFQGVLLSSAYVATVTSLLIGRSAVYKVYRTGPSTLPCGTPDLIGWHSDISCPYRT